MGINMEKEKKLIKMEQYMKDNSVIMPNMVKENSFFLMEHITKVISLEALHLVSVYMFHILEIE